MFVYEVKGRYFPHEKETGARILFYIGNSDLSWLSELTNMFMNEQGISKCKAPKSYRIYSFPAFFLNAGNFRMWLMRWYDQYRIMIQKPIYRFGIPFRYQGLTLRFDRDDELVPGTDTKIREYYLHINCCYTENEREKEHRQNLKVIRGYKEELLAPTPVQSKFFGLRLFSGRK